MHDFRLALLIVAAVCIVGAVAKAESAATACGSPKAEQLTPPCEIELDADVAWRRCEAKTGRFNGTNATQQQRDYFLFHCGLQAGVWLRRDP